ncbi:MAG: amino acid ABC transporter substrate-binding protein [Thiohalocapsa sp.]
MRRTRTLAGALLPWSIRQPVVQLVTHLVFGVALLAPLLATAATGALDRIKAAKTITIAYAPNAYPISFRDADGAPRGYSVDLCRRVVASVQRDLGLDALEVAWLEGNTPRRIAAVANGEADIECGTTTMTLERQRQVDFSNVVFVESGGILVKSDSGVRALADLGGKRLGVIPETTTERRLRPVLEERLINAQLVPIKDVRDGHEQLAAGALDAVASDRLLLIGQVAETGKAEDYAIVDADFAVEPYAFALPRNDADFRLAVNRGLAQVYRGGEVDRIFERWFGDDAEPTQLLETVFFIYGFAD